MSNKDKKLEKNGFWKVVFIIFIFIFPILVELCNYLLSKGWSNFPYSSIFPQIFKVIKENMSFYATALTITFTVYSFNKQQRKVEEDRRLDEQKREESRKEELKKANALKQKELEDKRDFYRPTFVVEKEKHDRHIKLLMRDNNLYLEDIKLYYSVNNISDKRYIANLKSGEFVAKMKGDSFYISARTQIGETILFGYINGGIKIHKYLKSKGNALLPRLGPNKYDYKLVEEHWGSYNVDDNDALRDLEPVFFYNTEALREVIVLNYSNSIEKTLQSTTASDFYHNVFNDLASGLGNRSFTSQSVKQVIMIILTNVKYTDYDSISLKFNNEIRYDYLQKLCESLCINFDSSIVKKSHFDFNNFYS